MTNLARSSHLTNNPPLWVCIFGESGNTLRVGTVRNAVVRPGTYVGMVREAMSSARCAWWYPLGILDAVITRSDPSGDVTHDTPVILVHGFGHNRSGWTVAQHHLREAGFTSIHTMNYDPFRHDIPALAEQLATRVKLIKMITGAERVHLVGHSLGGVLIRWYVQVLGGGQHVDTAITVASPHEGTRVAYGAVGPTAAQLRPGSPVMRRLARPAASEAKQVRWIGFYSNLDLLIRPARSAKISHPDLRATNILAKDHGHMSAMVSPVVARSIVHQLEASEGKPGTADLLPLIEPAAAAVSGSVSADVDVPHVVAVGH